MSREALLEKYPLIRLMEWLVLDVLGAMSAEHERRAASVISVTPGHDDWRKGIRELLATDAEDEAKIRAIWQQFVRDCGRQGVPADPLMFAEGYSDEWGRIQLEYARR